MIIDLFQTLNNITDIDSRKIGPKGKSDYRAYFRVLLEQVQKNLSAKENRKFFNLNYLRGSD